MKERHGTALDNDKYNLETPKELLNWMSPGDAKMCLGCMHFCAPHTSLKKKNPNNSPNMQPIIRFFAGSSRVGYFFFKKTVFCLAILKRQHVYLNVDDIKQCNVPFFPAFSMYPSLFAFLISVTEMHSG